MRISLSSSGTSQKAVPYRSPAFLLQYSFDRRLAKSVVLLQPKLSIAISPTCACTFKLTSQFIQTILNMKSKRLAQTHPSTVPVAVADAVIVVAS